jgi:hypothetical protein
MIHTYTKSKKKTLGSSLPQQQTTLAVISSPLKMESNSPAFSHWSKEKKRKKIPKILSVHSPNVK